MLLLSSLALAALAGSAQPRPNRQATRDSIRNEIRTAREEARQDTTRRHRIGHEPRHVPLTPELERTAFLDTTAHTLLLRARAARLSQDSALRAYDAKTYQRLSVGLGFRRIGRDRLLLRTENAARVHWDRERGVAIEPTGARAVFPMVKEADTDADMGDMTPIPYFPGRETLWFPSSSFGVAQAEVDDREFVHPLASGAEAYYRYATGDSQSVKLPDGRLVKLRELRITARRPDWHLFVGSFWFDVDRGQLVRAAYRMSVDMDIWRVADEEMKRGYDEAVERAKTDTSRAARAALATAKTDVDDAPPKWVKGMFTPMKATLSVITVEYGLHEGRFWLPRRNVAEGEGQAGFFRAPVKVEETYAYESVTGDVPHLVATRARDVVPSPSPASTAPKSLGTPRPSLADARTLLDSALARDPGGAAPATVTVAIHDGGANKAKVVDRDGVVEPSSHSATVDSTIRVLMHRADSLQRRADSLQLTGDTAKARTARQMSNARLRRAAALARRETQCAEGKTYDAGTHRRFDGALRVHMYLPCDSTVLANSPDLPKSPFEEGEQLFSGADRDALVNALDLSLQPGWAPQPLRFHTGLDVYRYNRVEGLSLGGTATSTLGAGYTFQGSARIGTADLVPNAELALSRSDGRRTISLGIFHRLGVANADWGSPLSFGASVASLLYSRDEGFYYRTFGGELTGTRAAPLFGASVDWRLFAERQRTAGAAPNTQLSLGHAVASARFIDNIDAEQSTLAGGSAELSRAFGEDPNHTRLDTRTRIEAAAVRGSWLARSTSGYGRLMTEATLTQPLGGAMAGITVGAGAIGGDAPIQRQFFIGGLQTVRGQYAHPSGAGYAGDAFWLTRSELGTNALGFRPSVFFDAGWAGPRAEWQHPGRPLTGAGVGASFLDGLVRADLARGIYPQKKLRFDLSVEARF